MRKSRLFAELRREIVDEIDESEHEAMLSRFVPSDAGFRAPDLKRDWNRTVELPGDPVRGVALLMHGLSDSPYSLRAFAEVLKRRGFHVIVPRMPGHGAAPSGLANVRWRDWTGVVRLAAERLGEIVGETRNGEDSRSSMTPGFGSRLVAATE